MLMLQADTVRSALENPTRSWLFWIDQLLALCGCAAIRKAHPFQPQTNGSQNRFAIPAIISLVSLVMAGRLQNGYYQDEINGAFLFYFSAVLLFADVMPFALIVWDEKNERLKGENLTLTARSRTQTESIEALSASYTAQRKLTHDFNAHLATLSSYLDNGQIKDAQDYITTLQERQTDRILIANTHNSTIDALLNQKAQVAKKNNIDIRFKVNDLSGMDNRKMAEEIVRLVGACHGHALVLFTSYRQMAEVRALTDGQWQYPTYQAWRNGGKIIQKFKESGNGVLFAAGSCWEGIDFPGDMVSLLIIARLPFPIPDPVSDYERQKYPNLQEYIAAEITPEMQKKLRQGFGRAIRTEQDSCVVAILDERAAPGAKYHNAALAALPDCQTTSKIEDVQHFIREQKHPDYFCEKGL